MISVLRVPNKHCIPYGLHGKCSLLSMCRTKKVQRARIEKILRRLPFVCAARKPVEVVSALLDRSESTILSRFSPNRMNRLGPADCMPSTYFRLSGFSRPHEIQQHIMERNHLPRVCGEIRERTALTGQRPLRPRMTRTRPPDELGAAGVNEPLYYFALIRVLCRNRITYTE